MPRMLPPECSSSVGAANAGSAFGAGVAAGCGAAISGAEADAAAALLAVLFFLVTAFFLPVFFAAFFLAGFFSAATTPLPRSSSPDCLPDFSLSVVVSFAISDLSRIQFAPKYPLECKNGSTIPSR